MDHHRIGSTLCCHLVPGLWGHKVPPVSPSLFPAWSPNCWSCCHQPGCSYWGSNRSGRIWWSCYIYSVGRRAEGASALAARHPSLQICTGFQIYIDTSMTDDFQRSCHFWLYRLRHLRRWLCLPEGKINWSHKMENNELLKISTQWKGMRTNTGIIRGTNSRNMKLKAQLPSFNHLPTDSITTTVKNLTAPLMSLNQVQLNLKEMEDLLTTADLSLTLVLRGGTGGPVESRQHV